MDEAELLTSDDEDLLEAPEPYQHLGRMDRIRLVVKNRAFAKIEGVLVDMQTANLVCQIYDRLNPTNQSSLLKMSLPRMVDTCWKVYAKISK